MLATFFMEWQMWHPSGKGIAFPLEKEEICKRHMLILSLHIVFTENYYQKHWKKTHKTTSVIIKLMRENEITVLAK